MIFGKINNKKAEQDKRKAIAKALATGKVLKKKKPLGMWIINGDSVTCPDGSVITRSEYDMRAKDEEQEYEDSELQTITEMIVEDITSIHVEVVKPKHYEKNIVWEETRADMPMGTLPKGNEPEQIRNKAGRPKTKTFTEKIAGIFQHKPDVLDVVVNGGIEFPDVAREEEPVLFQDFVTRNNEPYIFSTNDKWAPMRQQILNDFNKRR